MSPTPRLTDAALLVALAPAPDVGAPADLLRAIGEDIRHTPQQPAVPWLRGLPEVGLRPWAPNARRLAWALVIVAVLAALVGAAIVGSRLVRRTQLEPTSRTIVETLTPESGVVERVVVDGRGTLWATAPGRLTRFDASGSERRTWTVSDDVAFAEGLVAAARDGGVWVWSGSTIRRFTGEAFVEEIPAPAWDGIDLVEADSGDLWAQSPDQGLQRWDGSRWLALPGAPRSTAKGPVLVRGDGDVWVGTSTGAVSHLMDGTWVTYDGGDTPLLGRAVLRIVEAGDGSIWMTLDRPDRRIVRFDGRDWSLIDSPGFPASWLETATDGGMWAVTDVDPPVEVARFANGRWARYGIADGLAGTVAGLVSATPEGVFLGTNVGLFRFADDRWVPAWPDAIQGPGYVHALAAVATDEAWAADLRGVWHYRAGVWQGPWQPWARVVEPATQALGLGPDGAVWAAGDEGVAVMRDGIWTIASTLATTALAIGPDGSAWVADGQELIGLRLTSGGVQTRSVSCPVPYARLAVAPDGSVYLGSATVGLMHFDGQTCAALDPPVVADPYGVVRMTIDQSGALVAYLRGTRAGGAPASYLARLDAGRWTVTAMTDGGAEGDILAVAPSGEGWRVTLRPGFPTAVIERSDGDRWIQVVTGVNITGPISVAPDGTVWFGGPSGVQRIPADALPGR